MNARPRDWHQDEGLVPLDDTDPRPSNRIALLVVGIAFCALILGALALASMLYDPSGGVRHAVSAQPSVLWVNPHWMSDLLDWLR